MCITYFCIVAVKLEKSLFRIQLKGEQFGNYIENIQPHDTKNKQLFPLHFEMSRRKQTASEYSL